MSIATFVSEQLSVLEAAYLEKKIGPEEYAAAVDAVLTKSGMLTEVEKDAQSALEKLTGDFLAGKIGPEQYAAAILSIKSAVDSLPTYKKVTIEIEEQRKYTNVAPDLQNALIEGGYPGYASGGISGGGLTWVGERGPELVNLPRGAQVHDAQTSQSIVNHNYGGMTIHTQASSDTYGQDFALLQALAQ